jgi:hypothetical protein
LFAPLAAIVAESWTWTAALLANPITWIVLAVIVLTAAFVILYIKVKPFRDFVNWMWHHPMVTMFIPVIGPLITMAHLFETIYHHLKQIYDLVRHPLRPLSGLNPTHRGFWHGALNFGRSLLPFGGHIPFMATGGNIVGGGSVMVGDNGPELLNLPPGAQVKPLANGMGGTTDGANQSRQPLIVQFVVGQRVLEQAVMDIIGGRLAQA